MYQPLRRKRSARASSSKALEATHYLVFSTARENEHMSVSHTSRANEEKARRT